MAIKSRVAATRKGKGRKVSRSTGLGAAAATRKAAREARLTASEVAKSAEARRALAQAHAAIDALGNAATAATALIRAAWRTTGRHAQAFGKSREIRALQKSAQTAARNAATTARIAGEKTWEQTVTGGKNLMARAESAVARTRRRFGAAAKK